MQSAAPGLITCDLAAFGLLLGAASPCVCS
jgi:hypothetical protein